MNGIVQQVAVVSVREIMKGSGFHSTLLKTKIIITLSIIVIVKTKSRKYIFVRNSFFPTLEVFP